MKTINWQFFPKSEAIPQHLKEVVTIFEKNEISINSFNHQHTSNKVLELLRVDLERINYQIEKSKKLVDKIKVPVLFGRSGSLEKSFDADGYNESTKSVLEIEAGRGVTNYQFLKDLFQACMMHEVEYLTIAVRNIYKDQKDFEIVDRFFDTLYTSNRIKLPLKGILIVGY